MIYLNLKNDLSKSENDLSKSKKDLSKSEKMNYLNLRK